MAIDESSHLEDCNAIPWSACYSSYLPKLEVGRIVMRLRRTLQGGSTPYAHRDPTPKLGWADVLCFLKGEITIGMDNIIRKVDEKI